MNIGKYVIKTALSRPSPSFVVFILAPSTKPQFCSPVRLIRSAILLSKKQAACCHQRVASGVQISLTETGRGTVANQLQTPMAQITKNTFIPTIGKSISIPADSHSARAN
jgi:hypothetical protein